VGLPLVPPEVSEDPADDEDVRSPVLVVADELGAELRAGVVVAVVGARFVVVGVVCCTWVGWVPPVLPVVATVAVSGRTTSQSAKTPANSTAMITVDVRAGPTCAGTRDQPQRDRGGAVLTVGPAVTGAAG